MDQDNISATLRRQSGAERARGNLDYADALLEADEVYAASGHDYWATITEMRKRVPRRRMDLGVHLLRAIDVVRRAWTSPGVDDPTTARLHARSEQERERGRLDEADALLDVADVYEANSRDYRATLTVISVMVHQRGVVEGAKLLTAEDWFRGVWTESPETAAKTAPAAAKPAKGGLFRR